MKICENGVIREMTQEEIDSMNTEEMVESKPTVEERLEAIESALLERLLGGLNNV